MNSSHEEMSSSRMSSSVKFSSWQDTFIFCLEPNFKKDLFIFMIFASIQVGIAGLKLVSFFISRWARSSKVGSEDGSNDRDNGAISSISILGVLALISGTKKVH